MLKSVDVGENFFFLFMKAYFLSQEFSVQHMIWKRSGLSSRVFQGMQMELKREETGKHLQV